MDTAVINKKRYILVPEEEYKLLTRGVPPLPQKVASGNFPALPLIDAQIARSIVRDRESVGLTQRELAKAAGIRVEVLNRIERGINLPSYKTATKIENALVKAGLVRKPLQR